MSHRKRKRLFRVSGSYKPVSADGIQRDNEDCSLSDPNIQRPSVSVNPIIQGIPISVKPNTWRSLMSTQERHLELLEAADMGDSTTVRSLLAQGFDANFFDDPMITPLVRASVRGHLEVVRILLDARAYDPERGDTDALTWAAFLGQPAVVDLLLQHCSGHFLRSESKLPPPHGLKRIKPIDCVQMLLQNEAVAGSAGTTETTLSWARAKGYTKIAQIMEAEGIGRIKDVPKPSNVVGNTGDQWADPPTEATDHASYPAEDVYRSALARDFSETRRLLEGNNPHYLFKLYFRNYPFGSQKYAPTFLSTLPPKERVEILEQAIEDDPKNQKIYDRLGLAYLKDGRRREAHRRLEQAMTEGNVSTSFFNQMTEVIRMMHTSSPDGYGSATNYAEARKALARFVDADDEINYKDFLSIYETFCFLRESDGEQ